MAAPQPNLDRYLAALWPDTHRCLGRRLLPLRIGHILLLRRVGSPFGAAIDRTPDGVDIATAVAICSRTVADATRFVQSSGLALRLIPLALRAQWRRREASAQLLAYFRAGMDGPKFWHRGDSKPLATPFWLSVMVTLCRELGRTGEEALEAVAAAALWECAAVWEATGQATFRSDDEEQAMERARTLAAEGN